MVSVCVSAFRNRLKRRCSSKASLMTESSTGASAVDAAVTESGLSAGALLRAARQRQGLHLSVLAASIKVSPAKLEALEADRYDDLPDLTFARVLAKTLCRSLKIDAAPVLALLPGAVPVGLGRVDTGLNTPFRERPGRVVPADWAPWRHPVLWLVVVLLGAAAAFVLVPSGAVRDFSLSNAAEAASAPVMPPSGAGVADAPIVAEPVASAAVAPVVASAPAFAASMASASAVPAASLPLSAASAAEALVLRAVESTWVQVVDGSGQTLVARLLPPGEIVTLTPVPPLRVKIGNVRGTELSYRGQAVDMASAKRDNIANLVLPAP
jgi:cytoskeleton protein RodZ